MSVEHSEKGTILIVDERITVVYACDPETGGSDYRGDEKLRIVPFYGNLVITR